MKAATYITKKMLGLGLALGLLAGSVMGAQAHETHLYEIGGEYYRITAGSLNEPITVDDRTGVHVQVYQSQGAVENRATETPVTGLADTLQVELQAGDEKKVVNLTPTYGEEGSYYSTFYPTVATTYTYRFFGTINDTPVDLEFTCNSSGHVHVDANTERTEMSEGVYRVLSRGTFGCPADKAALGFPEESSSVVELNERVNSVEENASSNTRANMAFIVGVVALGMSATALTLKK
jgi:hypothetical protein